ncbi:MAG: hypothetical protein IMY67_11405 [Bacteroidetes bacterium]|nr:hypothetical protein [Bacteroidota bacterium]
MKPNISEFSYGYALTEELAKSFGSSITASPVFPSLYEEGKKGGGWDVKLEKGGIPLFLQFKLSHYLKNANAKERISGNFLSPYYRMHIRPINHSKQHELLLELERLGNEVYYSAPGFHEPKELNDAYLTNKVKNKSIWVKPTDIGDITDTDEHYLAFQLPTTWFFCSKPKPIERNLSFSVFQENIISALYQRKETALTRNSLIELANSLESIGKKRKDIHMEDEHRITGIKTLIDGENIKAISPEWPPIDNSAIIKETFSNRHPIELVSYYSSMYLDSQLVIVQ